MDAIVLGGIDMHIIQSIWFFLLLLLLLEGCMLWISKIHACKFSIKLKIFKIRELRHCDQSSFLAKIWFPILPSNNSQIVLAQKKSPDWIYNWAQLVHYLSLDKLNFWLLMKNLSFTSHNLMYYTLILKWIYNVRTYIYM